MACVQFRGRALLSTAVLAFMGVGAGAGPESAAVGNHAIVTAAYTAGCAPMQPAQESRVETVRLPIPHARGLAPLPGGRWLVVASARNGVFIARRLEPGVPISAVTALGPQLEGKVELEGLEDVAADGQGNVYLLAAHGRTPRGDAPESRLRLARLRFDPQGELLEARQTRALADAIVNQIPFLADALRRPPARAGLKLEGLAWSAGGELLVGLRSPTVTESRPRPDGSHEDAVFLRIRNPAGPFSAVPEELVLGEVTTQNLGGQGVRGLAWDAARRRHWIVTGLSAEPNHPVASPWGLFAGAEGSAPARMRLPAGVAVSDPTGVALSNGGTHLLLLEGSAADSRVSRIPLQFIEEEPASTPKVKAREEAGA